MCVSLYCPKVHAVHLVLVGEVQRVRTLISDKLWRRTSSLFMFWPLRMAFSRNHLKKTNEYETVGLRGSYVLVIVMLPFGGKETFELFPDCVVLSV